MPARATRLTPALALGAALALAACGDPAAPAPPSVGVQYPERTIRVLDPGERLYDHGHGQDPDWRTLDPATGAWVLADVRGADAAGLSSAPRGHPFRPMFALRGSSATIPDSCSSPSHNASRPSSRGSRAPDG